MSGHVTVKNQVNKWYYGTYGTRSQSHMHSFNHALYRYISRVAFVVSYAQCAIDIMRKRIPQLSEEGLTPPKRSRRAEPPPALSPATKCICCDPPVSTPRRPTASCRGLSTTPPKLERSLYRGGLPARGKRVVVPLPF
jgi:hypothetical protein